MNGRYPEIQELLQRVEKTYGEKLSVSSDYFCLYTDIKQKMKANISFSTLKRIYGYVPYSSSPRIATLNVLARYIGERDFDSFCEKLKKENFNQSHFFTSENIQSCELPTGQTLEIAWAPNRYLRLMHLGNSRFRVTESRNSQIQIEDVFCASEFILGMPLFLHDLEREGLDQHMFIAGKKGGLTLLNRI